MKKNILISALIFSTMSLYAQPPEQMPPLEVKQMTEEEKRLFHSPDQNQSVEVIEIPTTQTEAPQTLESSPDPVVMPVATPIQATVAAPAASSEKGGLSADFAVDIVPFGYDSINITGDGPEAGRYFFSLVPSVDLNTVLKSSKGKDTSLNMNYYLNWREYLNKATTSRDFEHGLTVSLGHDWSDVISSSISGELYYFFKAGEDTNFDNALLIFANPLANFKINDKIGLKLGYTAKYLSLPDWKITPGSVNTSSGFPTDLEDLSSGGTSYFDDVFAPDLSGFSNEQVVYWIENWLVMGGSIKPVDGTSIGLTYNYNFTMVGNLDSTLWKGHYITPSFSQKMPWEGGKLSISNELRIRNYDFAKASGSTTAKQNFRNRLTFKMTQSITESLSWTGYYRFEMEAGNNDDFKEINDNHWFYTGVTYSF